MRPRSMFSAAINYHWRFFSYIKKNEHDVLSVLIITLYAMKSERWARVCNHVFYAWN